MDSNKKIFTNLLAEMVTTCQIVSERAADKRRPLPGIVEASEAIMARFRTAYPQVVTSQMSVEPILMCWCGMCDDPMVMLRYNELLTDAIIDSGITRLEEE